MDLHTWLIHCAQDKACLMESSVSIGSNKMEITECLQNKGVAQAQFVETCSSLVQATAVFGGPAATLAESKTGCQAQGGRWR